jgi:hypothetical protein
MTETASAENVVTRGRVEDALRAAARAERPKAAVAGKAMFWAGLIAAATLTIAAISRFAALEMSSWSLLQAENSAVAAELARGGPSDATPAYLEMLAELGVQPETKNHEAALAAAQRAVKADPSRAGAWALLAYLEYSKNTRVTPEALEALKASMDACAVCNQDLIRWRFNFVLANWADVPDDIRHRAFDQADVLRWLGPNREFLGEMRIKAEQAGIPFERYRAAVKTPVRSFDIAPQSETAELLRPRT